LILTTKYLRFANISPQEESVYENERLQDVPGTDSRSLSEPALIWESCSTHVSHTGENASCGDKLTFDIRLADNNETIEEVSFRGDGCAISLASTSILAEKLPGMTLEDVRELDRDDAIDTLDIDISPMRIDCAILVERVVQDRIDEHTRHGSID